MFELIHYVIRIWPNNDYTNGFIVSNFVGVVVVMKRV